MNLMHAKRPTVTYCWRYAGWALLVISFTPPLTSQGAERNPDAIRSGSVESTGPLADETKAVVTKGDFIRHIPSHPYAYVECKAQAVSMSRLIDGGMEGQCSHLTVGGSPVTVPEWENVLPNWPPGSSITPMAQIGPIDTVAVMEGYHWGNTPFRHTAYMGVTLNGKRLMVRPEELWTNASTGCEGRVVVGNRPGGWQLCADVIATEQPRPETASLIIRHWKTKLPCTFKISTGRVWERRYFPLTPQKGTEDEDAPWGPCSENTAESIEFESFPSAARILLTDDPGCSKGQEGAPAGKDFWIELRTTAKSVTSEQALPLDEILTYPEGSIVRPGLLLVASHVGSGKVATRNLGCIRVTTSAAPPAN